jgi:hypothetical protein
MFEKYKRTGDTCLLKQILNRKILVSERYSLIANLPVWDFDDLRTLQISILIGSLDRTYFYNSERNI